MSDPNAILYFDFVDPLSYLLSRELDAIADEGVTPVGYIGFELRPPPTPLITIADAGIAGRWAAADELAASLDLSLSPPQLMPWSRKAHELHLLAASHGIAHSVRAAIFASYHGEGRDIGRVDVLVDIGRASGLDPSETKAALDVDRFQGAVAEARRVAEAAGVGEPPTLVHGSSRLEGFHNRSTLSTFLRPS